MIVISSCEILGAESIITFKSTQSGNLTVDKFLAISPPGDINNPTVHKRILANRVARTKTVDRGGPRKSGVFQMLLQTKDRETERPFIKLINKCSDVTEIWAGLKSEIEGDSPGQADC